MKFTPNPDDPRPAWDQWKAWAGSRRAHGKVAETHAVLEEGYAWQHPDGCRTEALPGTKAYPRCSHGVQALFLGRDGDIYVGTSGPQGLDLRDHGELPLNP